jgi:hypothetical protein
VAHWTLTDIPWDRFDPTKVEPGILRLVKAASLVEWNGADYTRYLCNVFADDAAFQDAARVWGGEEVQHGEALGRWSMLADPSFDHAAACTRFSAGFRVNLDAQRSLRDELRHYKLFYTHMKRYLARERLGFWGRLRVAFGRIRESEDDELSYAFFVANARPGDAYDRRRAHRDYLTAAARVYRPHHLERAVAMTFKAIGLKPHGRLNLLASDLAWRLLRRRAAA